MFAGVVFLGCISSLTGCAIRLRFYPVAGPVASAKPNQVFVGKITASSTFNPKSGGFSAVLDDGEIFNGTWAMVRPESAGHGALAGTKPIGDAWDAVYEKGFYTAHVLGQREYGRSVTAGSKGTTLQVEICTAGPEAGGTKAVAQDSKGNIYKVTPY
jgi:hypothetical protein